MPSSRLHLKRTPAEQAEREWRKAQKAARKAAKRKHRYDDDDDATYSPKRTRSEAAHSGSADTWNDSDSEYGPPPPPSGSSCAHKPDFDQIFAEVEEERFREKMWGAYGDDERLDSVEASMNSYAHIPRRWRGGGMERMDDELNVDPHLMEDEEYTEWLRAGMWRKKHAAEHAEQARKQAERAARLEREKALKAETVRLELAAERERDQRRRERAHMRAVEAREQYDARWKDMLGTSEQQDSLLRFGDIPWPIIGFETKGSRRSAVLIEDFTADAISSFLLPATHVDAGLDEETLKKDRKEKLRETILRFHPDKFEGRIMGRVCVADKELVREAVGIVVRTVSGLMGEGK